MEKRLVRMCQLNYIKALYKLYIIIMKSRLTVLYIHSLSVCHEMTDMVCKIV